MLITIFGWLREIYTSTFLYRYNKVYFGNESSAWAVVDLL